jgi:two-component system, NarL family, sensor kinase
MIGVKHSVCTLFLIMLSSAFQCSIAQIEHSPEQSEKIVRMWHSQRDSFLREIRTTHSDTFQIHFYCELASVIHSLGNFDSAVHFANKAYDMAEKINHVPSMIESLTTLGNLYGNFGARDYEKSLHYLHQAAELAETHKLYVLTHKAYSCVLNLYFYGGDFPAAMDLTTKGMALAEQRDDVPQIATYNNLLGFIYLRQGNAERSRKFYRQYLTLSQTLRDSMAIADAYNCLAEVYFLEQKFSDALRYHFVSWSIYKRYYDAGVNFKHDQIAYTAYKISRTFKMLQKYDDAIRYSSLGLAFTKIRPANEYDLVSYYLNAAELYKIQGDLSAALTQVHEALRFSLHMKHRENIRDSYQLVSEIFREKNRLDSAYYYHVLYAAMKDSIVNENTHREIQQQQARYDLQKKDQEIAMQQAELEQREFQRNALIASFLFLAIFMFLLYNWYRLKQKNKFQAELTHRQNELFNTIVTFQDSERQRIAKDIHDSVGSVLSAAKLQLSSLEGAKEKLSGENQRSYEAALMLIDQATQELRNISHNIMPAALSRLGLVVALENLIEKISTYSGVQINFNVHGFRERLAEKTEIGIYPVVLELINNVLRHAHASEATVQLVKHPAYINITVEDNGRGFNIKTSKGDGIGLKNVMSRIQYLKGSINIDSEAGQGTSIMIDIPY